VPQCAVVEKVCILSTAEPRLFKPAWGDEKEGCFCQLYAVWYLAEVSSSLTDCAAEVSRMANTSEAITTLELVR